jgi:predicted transcriptional regulator
MKILLSIKPNFVAEISSGKKIFEFRKILYKRRDLKRIVVYSSSPVCRVVGEIEVDDILCDTPSKIWDRTKTAAGISKMSFDKYFEGKNIAYAIKIKSFKPYSEPMRLEMKYPGITPPQSFCYI